MPYRIVMVGEKHCVEKKDGGKRMGCHASHKEASDQVKAIYANERK